jgi:hypothetical protein
MGKRINTYRVLVKKPGGKRPLERPRFEREYNINVDLKDVGWEGLDWTNLAQDMDRRWAVVNTVLKFWVP